MAKLPTSKEAGALVDSVLDIADKYTPNTTFSVLGDPVRDCLARFQIPVHDNSMLFFHLKHCLQQVPQLAPVLRIVKTRQGINRSGFNLEPLPIPMTDFNGIPGKDYSQGIRPGLWEIARTQYSLQDGRHRGIDGIFSDENITMFKYAFLLGAFREGFRGGRFDAFKEFVDTRHSAMINS